MAVIFHCEFWQIRGRFTGIKYRKLCLRVCFESKWIRRCALGPDWVGKPAMASFALISTKHFCLSDRGALWTGRCLHPALTGILQISCWSLRGACLPDRCRPFGAGGWCFFGSFFINNQCRRESIVDVFYSVPQFILYIVFVFDECFVAAMRVTQQQLNAAMKPVITKPSGFKQRFNLDGIFCGKEPMPTALLTPRHFLRPTLWQTVRCSHWSHRDVCQNCFLAVNHARTLIIRFTLFNDPPVAQVERISEPGLLWALASSSIHIDADAAGDRHYRAGKVHGLIHNKWLPSINNGL